jgi:hypothetical protein
MSTRCAAQARELDALKGYKTEVERLKAIIATLQRHRSGRRSEQLDPGRRVNRGALPAYREL